MVPKQTYKWDVFISYPRRDGIREWVAEVLRPQIEETLQNVGLGRQATVFRDSEQLEAGDIWLPKLSEAHASSRIFVAVLCHAYFESRWCCSEWKTASARDKGTHGCIIPIRYNDLGEETLKKLPPVWRKDLTKRQFHDLNEFTCLVNRRSDTDLALRFRREIARLGEKVLKEAILRAPPRNRAWPRLPTDPVIREAPAFRARFGRPR